MHSTALALCLGAPLAWRPRGRMTPAHTSVMPGWTHRARARSRVGGGTPRGPGERGVHATVRARRPTTAAPTAGENWRIAPSRYSTTTPGGSRRQARSVAQSPHTGRGALPERGRPARGRLPPLLRGCPRRRGARPVHRAAAAASPEVGHPVRGGPMTVPGRLPDFLLLGAEVRDLGPARGLARHHALCLSDPRSQFS